MRASLTVLCESEGCAVAAKPEIHTWGRDGVFPKFYPPRGWVVVRHTPHAVSVYCSEKCAAESRPRLRLLDALEGFSANPPKETP